MSTKEPSILKEYNQVFKDQRHERIIKRVDETEENIKPHQAVIRSNALTTIFIDNLVVENILSMGI